MKLLAFVIVALFFAATSGGEENVKTANNQDKAFFDAKKEFAALKAELKRLSGETGKQKAELETQKKEIKERKLENEEQAKKNEKQAKEIADQRKEIADQKKENHDLRQQIKRQKTFTEIEIREESGQNFKAIGNPRPRRVAISPTKTACGYTKSGDASKEPYPILMFWYEFRTAHVPTRFSFRRLDDQSAPKTWQFIGSRSLRCTHASTWKPLCGNTVGDKKIKAEEEVGCTVPESARERFKCLGIRVYSNNSEPHPVCVQAMKFWEFHETGLILTEIPL